MSSIQRVKQVWNHIHCRSDHSGKWCLPSGFDRVGRPASDNLDCGVAFQFDPRCMCSPMSGVGNQTGEIETNPGRPFTNAKIVGRKPMGGGESNSRKSGSLMITQQPEGLRSNGVDRGIQRVNLGLGPISTKF
jgi:hypothetical protein